MGRKGIMAFAAPGRIAAILALVMLLNGCSAGEAGALESAGTTVKAWIGDGYAGTESADNISTGDPDPDNGKEEVPESASGETDRTEEKERPDVVDRMEETEQPGTVDRTEETEQPGTVDRMEETEQPGTVDRTEEMDYSPDSAVVRKSGTLVGVNEDGGSITVKVTGTYTNELGGSTEYNEDIIFHIPEGAPLLDAMTGLPMGAGDLTIGESVYAWAGDTMTLSLPAQMVLEALAADLPADSAAPQFVVVKGTEWSEDGSGLYITDQYGEVWEASEEGTAVAPFKTRQIVTLSDIEYGSRIFAYRGETGETFKIIIIE